MTKELWAIGDIKKAKKHCLDCKNLLLGSVIVEEIPCFVCNNKNCKFVKKEYLKYGKLDDETIINLRVLN